MPDNPPTPQGAPSAPCCAHRTVSWRTKDVPYDGPVVPGSGPNAPLRPGMMLTQGWWECDYGCGMKFEPAAAVRRGEEERAALLETCALLADAEAVIAAKKMEVAKRMDLRFAHADAAARSAAAERIASAIRALATPRSGEPSRCPVCLHEAHTEPCIYSFLDTAYGECGCLHLAASAPPAPTRPATSDDCPTCGRLMTECVTSDGGQAFVCFNTSCNNLVVRLSPPAPSAEAELHRVAQEVGQHLVERGVIVGKITNLAPPPTEDGADG